MRFLIDANLPRNTRSFIFALGYESVDVRDIRMANASDHMIAAYAKQEGFIILTRDRDFGDIRKHPASAHSGVIVIILPIDATRKDVLATIGNILEQRELIEQTQGKTLLVWKDRIQARG